jgi:3-phenylpropionate/trans-cinnamate dioxygenase ferredoxin reductase subunit
MRVEGEAVRSYRYLIVGGGMTGDAAARGIRERDPDGSIGIVGAEAHAPYARPPLTKGLWAGKDEDSIWRRTEETGAELQLGRRIVSLDLHERRATDDAGERYGYERLLLATGGSPRRLPFGGDDVLYFRTLDDYRWLRAAASPDTRATVVGGGFIGSEVAAALTRNGCQVTVVFPEPGICARVLPAELSDSVSDYYREQGVEVRAGVSVQGVERLGGGVRVLLDDGATIDGDFVVAGLGITPQTELAQRAGLDVEDGILVDAHGRTSAGDDVFAAGDVARFPVAALGGTMRVEHEDHAKSHGKLVGMNMAGAGERYDHLPFFYSDLFELGYEAVGDLDPRQQTLAEWLQPFRKGVVYYLDERRRPRGVLLWNVWGKLEQARRLIEARQPLEAGALGAD